MTDPALFVGLALAVVTVVLLVIVVRQRNREVPVTHGHLRAAQAEWQPPAELQSQSVPRNVRLTAQGRTLTVLFAVMGVGLVGFGAYLIPGMRSTDADTALVAREGTATIATITHITHLRNASAW